MSSCLWLLLLTSVINGQFLILHSIEKNVIHPNKYLPNSVFTRKKVCFSKLFINNDSKKTPFVFTGSEREGFNTF